MEEGKYFTNKDEAIELAKLASKLWILDFAVCRRFEAYFVRELNQAFKARETILGKAYNGEVIMYQ
jgi:hypothetical protein